MVIFRSFCISQELKIALTLRSSFEENLEVSASL